VAESVDEMCGEPVDEPVAVGGLDTRVVIVEAKNGALVIDADEEGAVIAVTTTTPPAIGGTEDVTICSL
jgi:hypothetical protein